MKGQLLVLVVCGFVAGCVAEDTVGDEERWSDDSPLVYMDDGVDGSCIGPCPKKDLCSFVWSGDPIGVYRVLALQYFGGDERDAQCVNPYALDAQVYSLELEAAVLGEPPERVGSAVQLSPYGWAHVKVGSLLIAVIHHDGGIAHVGAAVQLSASGRSGLQDTELPGTLGAFRERAQRLREVYDDPQVCASLKESHGGNEEDSGVEEFIRDECR